MRNAQCVYSRVAFVCGPYRAGHGRTVLQNIRAAELVAIDAWRAGYAVICPHLNTAHFDGLLPDSAWLEGDLAILARCDLLIVMDGWERSEGARREVAYAQRNKIPTIAAGSLRHRNGGSAVEGTE